jgi:hypothetical protein
MTNVGLLVRLEAKEGMGPSTFGIFDAFPDDSGRDAHLNGRVAEALMGRADELFSQPPSIERVDVIAEKLPGS